MFEALSAWREVGHLAEYTGLSVGALAGCAALFLYVPGVRLFVAAAAIAVVAGGLGLVHGESVGHRDGTAEVQAQWDEARAQAIKAGEERDQLTEQNLEQKYQPQLAELAKAAADSKARADDYERKITTGKGNKAVAACELGDAAGSVPVPRPAPKLRAR